MPSNRTERLKKIAFGFLVVIVMLLGGVLTMNARLQRTLQNNPELAACLRGGEAPADCKAKHPPQRLP